MDATSRLALPLLMAGQVQKEIYHNEALALLDLMVGGVADGSEIAAPPANPTLGLCYLVAASGASGLFAGHEDQIAGWTAGGWRFIPPVDGLRLQSRATGVDVVRWNGGWTSGSVRALEVRINGVKVLGSAGSAIADPAGGSTVDANARACLALVLAALRSHGLIAS